MYRKKQTTKKPKKHRKFNMNYNPKKRKKHEIKN